MKFLFVFCGALRRDIHRVHKCSGLRLTVCNMKIYSEGMSGNIYAASVGCCRGFILFCPENCSLCGNFCQVLKTMVVILLLLQISHFSLGVVHK